MPYKNCAFQRQPAVRRLARFFLSLRRVWVVTYQQVDIARSQFTNTTPAFDVRNKAKLTQLEIKH